MLLQVKEGKLLTECPGLQVSDDDVLRDQLLKELEEAYAENIKLKKENEKLKDLTEMKSDVTVLKDDMAFVKCMNMFFYIPACPLFIDMFMCIYFFCSLVQLF